MSLYEPRGEYQLLIEQLEDAGHRRAAARVRELKARLAAEGLFAPERKRALPVAPRRIGIITSPTGAALRDILHILAAPIPRTPGADLPDPGTGCCGGSRHWSRRWSLPAARAECDVLILARGGGSLEDLWAFNDERLARADRCASPIPVVTGIGHEIDFTIADFVAEPRAPTPSALRSW